MLLSFSKTNLKMWRITAFLFLVTICITRLEVHADPLVPCFFIFGDSLSDAGNNNDLNTKAKANYPPYGIDYLDSVPTGRFTNGRTAVDILGVSSSSLLCFNLSQPITMLHFSLLSLALHVFDHNFSSF